MDSFEENLASKIIIELNTLKPEQRVKVFESLQKMFCSHCGYLKSKYTSACAVCLR